MTTVAAGSGLRRSTTVAEQEWGIAEIRQASIDKNGGYITQDELPAIIAINRLEQLLIRHSHGRMLCSAQDVAFHVRLIDDHSEAYLRDVCWPATSSNSVCIHAEKVASSLRR